MDFWTAVKTCYGKYATFRGRAARSEFWYFTLFTILVAAIAGVLDAALFWDAQNSPIYLIVTLVNLLPGLAVSVRRLHDTDHVGWWWLILFVPLIGVILLLVWYCTRGTQGQNRFGSDPLGPSVLA